MLDLLFALYVGFFEALQRVQSLSPLVFDQPHDSETALSQLLDDLEVAQFKPLRFGLDHDRLRGGHALVMLWQGSISAADHKVLILRPIPDSSTTVKACF